MALINVETKLETIFYEFKITGELLFDLRYLWSQINIYLQNNTYFPIMKLMYVILKLNLIENRSVAHVKFVKASTMNNEGSKKIKSA